MKIAFLTVDNRENERHYNMPDPFFGTAPTALLEGFADLHEPTVHVISCSQKPLRSPRQLAPSIHFHSLHVPKWGWLRTGYSGCVWAIQKKLREIQPDLVHAQGTERECAISAVFAPFPKLLTLHGNLRLIEGTIGFRLFSAPWFQARLEPMVVPRFQGVICITRYTRHAIQREAKMTWLVPNAVEKRFFAETPRREGQPLQELPAVLVIANVDSRKNQIFLVQALSELAKQRRFQLRFFGKCGNDAYGRRFLDLIGDFPWCHWGGMLDRVSLRDEFSRAHALVLPTREDNCPMVVLEAQASGVPVIASNVGGIPDLIEDGVSGLLMDPSSPATIVSALERILTDGPLAHRLSQNAHQQALSKFHPKIVARKHLEIYREVIASR